MQIRERKKCNQPQVMLKRVWWNCTVSILQGKSSIYYSFLWFFETSPNPLDIGGQKKNFPINSSEVWARTVGLRGSRARLAMTRRNGLEHVKRRPHYAMACDFASIFSSKNQYRSPVVVNSSSGNGRSGNSMSLPSSTMCYVGLLTFGRGEIQRISFSAL